MKKTIRIIAFILVIIMVALLSGCGQEPSTPNSFVDDGEERFMLVDSWKESMGTLVNTNCIVVADKVTGVMYLMVSAGYHMAMTPLYCEDGSLMLYDGVQ